MAEVTIAEAARRLGLPVEGVQELIRTGVLETVSVTTEDGGTGMGVVLPDEPQSAEADEQISVTTGAPEPPVITVPPVEPPPDPEPSIESTPQSWEQTPQGAAQPQPGPGETQVFDLSQLASDLESFETASNPTPTAPEETVLEGQGQVIDQAMADPAGSLSTEEASQAPSGTSPWEELVGALRSQLQAQQVELEARRREVLELHGLLKQLQERLLSLGQ